VEGSIGLEYKTILVSFTVWERTVLQTELIIMNSKTGKTLVMDEGTPGDSSLIRDELDRVVRNLLNGVYEHANPDPKLIIS
jgi:hypothetical protein